MTEVSRMKMAFQGLPPRGESSPLRRRAAGHQWRVKTGQIDIKLNNREGREYSFILFRFILSETLSEALFLLHEYVQTHRLYYDLAYLQNCHLCKGNR